MTPTKHHAHHNKAVLIPILMTCLGYACYNLCDVGSKQLLSPPMNLYFAQVMLTSAASVIFFMAIYGWFKEGKKAFRTGKPGLMFVRAALGQVSTICNLIALPYIHLTTFYTLVFTSPFWVALISAYFFKDKLDGRRMGVILFGFCVVLFIFHPGGKLFNGWALLILLGSFAYSWQLLVVRKIGSGESRPFMYMCGSVMSILIALPFLGNHYVPLTLYEWSIFAGIGLINSIGLLCISYAFQEAPSASAVAPYHYTQIIWGALLGYYCFSEIPNVETMVGAALIILAGLYLIHHETRKAALKPLEA
jgi:S-adenosylmethionine uptake transporter